MSVVQAFISEGLLSAIQRLCSPLTGLPSRSFTGRSSTTMERGKMTPQDRGYALPVSFTAITESGPERGNQNGPLL